MISHGENNAVTFHSSSDGRPALLHRFAIDEVTVDIETAVIYVRPNA
mgnify:FL=1